MMGKLRLGDKSADGFGPFTLYELTFASRLNALYSHWRKHKDDLWESADFLAMCTPPDDIRYLKSSTLIMWLLSCHLPETIMVFGSKCIHVLCSQTKVSLLESVKVSAKYYVNVDIVIHTMQRTEDRASELDDVLHRIRVSKSDAPIPIVGCIVDESPKGWILENWAEKITNSGFKLSDVTSGICHLFYLSDLYTVKDLNEVSFTKKAEYLAASAIKYFLVPKLKSAIDKEKEFTRSSLMDDTLYPRIYVELNADDADILYPPIFDNSGKFDLRRIAASNDDYFFYDSPTSIICAIGSRSNTYCYVARTYLINANAFQITAYKILLRSYDAAINAIKPGNRLSDVYSAALEVVMMDNPELVSKLTMIVGTSFGLELCESGLSVNLKNDRVIKDGLIYNISIGFQNVFIETDPLKCLTFSLLLGDTVAVGNHEAQVITRSCSKDVKEVLCSTDDIEEELDTGLKILYKGSSELYPLPNKHEISKEDLLRDLLFQLSNKKEKTPKRLAGEDSSAGVFNWANLKTSNELIGSHNNSFCSNVAKTFLIDANAMVSKAYKLLGRAHKAATCAVKPGSKMGDVYSAAVVDVLRDAPELAPNLTKTAGTCIGLEFDEAGLALDLKNDQVINAGMVFNISLGFQNLLIETGNPKSQTLSLLLEEMVVVTDSGCKIITRLSTKDVNDVAYYFIDAYDEKMELKVKVLYSQEISKTAKRFAGSGSAADDNRGSLNASSELIGYKSVDDLPPHSETMIHVDQKNEAVLLPIYGIMVPFHVSTVKRVSSLQDTKNNCYMRIIFSVPGTPFTHDDANSSKSHGTIYLKEVSFFSKDPSHISEVVQQIKTLRRYVLAREYDTTERTTLAVPEKLELVGNKCMPVRLSRSLIRPPFGGEPATEIIGALEAHANCFRYSTSKQDEGVDIMYANIKHAFFQPAENENEKVTLLHFHLHNHVMVGNTKTKDVQFYMEAVQTLGVEKPEEEQKRERDKINMDFEKFINDLKVQKELEFEQSLGKLGFHGVIVPYNIKAFLVPTSSCLVKLIENPFVVITLSEIEIVSLERIGVVGQKDFDMAIVYKDFKRDVTRIDTIPYTSLDGIIEWLDSVGIKYYVNNKNRNWQVILKTFNGDPQVFIEVGGWDFLKQEAATDSECEPTSDYDMSDYGDDMSDLHYDTDTMCGYDDGDDNTMLLIESDFEESDDGDDDESSSDCSLVVRGVLGQFHPVLFPLSNQTVEADV